MERLGSYEVLESTSKLFARASSIYQKQKLAVILAVLSVILTIVIIVLLALLPKSVTYCPDDTEVVTIESSSPVTYPEPSSPVTCPEPPTVTCPEVPSPSEPICSRIWVNHMGYCVRSLGPEVKYTMENARRFCEQKDATLVKNIDEHKKFLEYVWTGVTSYWIDSRESGVCLIGTQNHIPEYPEVRKVSCDERHSFICIKKGTD
ncbi:C-type lectin-like protein [Canarypox virus]|uniref:CNPV003 C-type lectin-like protein n=1 Tax=Canarypox virus TaxID=44088 RepID=Q6VZ21_CNPV|nr:C-type lectin-like protein [Canarypox virus]NP_955349.1 C-type lectin-like protein [Canarypox virus]AAR83349.1 CNPV003 C-type lectin-like protein [Canarypox virus]AAR83672.1 CNPV326 C-type lectin-like protein [Canarypox virus]AWD84479.1 C-type lectin-like protein [Canarypox virus]AWD84802.1 C-type lectin-like protein [Canarypox virus]